MNDCCCSIYFAPMEGITGYILRNAHHKVYKGIDRYFSPFIATSDGKTLGKKELADVLPEHNEGLVLIPQILSNKAVDFTRTARALKELGYEEVNLNLGCPSPTVVSKKRGAGFLGLKNELNAFLDSIYEDALKDNRKISIKTRIGKDSPDEFDELLSIYERYPVSELIIHPRIQKDMYKNTPNMEAFNKTFDYINVPVCYNGDICTYEDAKNILSSNDNVSSIMCGRGFLKNPALIKELKGNGKGTLDELKEFHDLVYEGYQNNVSGDRNLLFKMKELWYYLSYDYDLKKQMKLILKAERKCDYESAVRAMFNCMKGFYNE